MITDKGIADFLQGRYATGVGEQEERYEDALSALQKMVNLFGKGYGTGLKKKALSSANAGFIRSGLAPTTLPGAVSGNLSAEIEGQRRTGLAGSLSKLAEFLGSYRNPFDVSPELLTSGAQRAAYRPTPSVPSQPKVYGASWISPLFASNVSSSSNKPKTYGASWLNNTFDDSIFSESLGDFYR